MNKDSPKNGMGGQPRKEGLMHRNCLLERGQVLSLQLLLHAGELLLGKVAWKLKMVFS